MSGGTFTQVNSAGQRTSVVFVQALKYQAFYTVSTKKTNTKQEMGFQFRIPEIKIPVYAMRDV